MSNTLAGAMAMWEASAPVPSTASHMNPPIVSALSNQRDLRRVWGWSTRSPQE
jgi:hypothetical protein